MIELTQEQSVDGPAIETLLDQAFGPGRERKTSYRFRRNVASLGALSYVARAAGEIVGTVRLWPIAIGADRAPALLLGPLAVRQEERGRGLGHELMETALAAAAAAGHQRVLLVGDLAYYHRFGFVPAAGWGVTMPGERNERLLLKPLVEGAFDGVTGDIVAAGTPTRNHRAPFKKVVRAPRLLPVVPQAA